MRHVIVRGIMAVIWVAAGIVGLVQGRMDIGGFAILFGAVYGYSSLKLMRKVKGDDK